MGQKGVVGRCCVVFGCDTGNKCNEYIRTVILGDGMDS
jgi:hypothetical protein